MAGIGQLVRKPQKTSQVAQNSDDPQQRFQYYWDKIEKAKKSYAAAERQRQRIVDQFNEEILPLEQKHSSVLYDFINNLLSFCDKKSLSRTDREYLLDWIFEEIEQLMASPFRGNIDTESLLRTAHEELEKLRAKAKRKNVPLDVDEMAYIREMMSDLGLDALDFSDEELQNIFKSYHKAPEKFIEAILKKATEKSDQQTEATESQEDIEPSEPETPFESFFKKFNQKHAEETHDTPLPKNENILAKKSLNTLYKKLAQKIHPDRAENEIDRAQKHEVMLQLSEAKKNNDAFTIFNLYHQYANDGDFSFESEEIEQMSILLQQKLSTLQAKRRDLKQAHNMEAMVYQKFHARSKKAIAMKFLEHQESLLYQINMIKQNMKKLNNVKQLKRKLKLMQTRNNEMEEIIYLLGNQGI